MADTLGEKLRAAREERGISVSEVAEQTRIAPMYIKNIEDDNYKPLPGGIFNKGFVKSYARFIGMDEQEALQDYARIAAQAEGTPEDHLRSYRPEVLTDDRASQSTLPTIIFAGIILALMTGGILFLVNYLQSQPATPTVATNAAPSNTNTVQTEQPAAPPVGNVPTMQSLKVEFRAATEDIWLSSSSDGVSRESTVTADTPQTFEPRQSLRLSYAKAKAASAQLFINGKQITLPSQPANPKRVPIEIEINAGNLERIWTSGAVTFDTPAAANTNASTPAANTSPQSTPRPPTPTPAARTTPAAANAARATPTPIIAGGNRNAAPRRTPN